MGKLYGLANFYNSSLTFKLNILPDINNNKVIHVHELTYCQIQNEQFCFDSHLGKETLDNIQEAFNESDRISQNPFINIKDTYFLEYELLENNMLEISGIIPVNSKNKLYTFAKPIIVSNKHISEFKKKVFDLKKYIYDPYVMSAMIRWVSWFNSEDLNEFCNVDSNTNEPQSFNHKILDKYINIICKEIEEEHKITTNDQIKQQITDIFETEIGVKKFFEYVVKYNDENKEYNKNPDEYIKNLDIYTGRNRGLELKQKTLWMGALDKGHNIGFKFEQSGSFQQNLENERRNSQDKTL